MKRVRFLAHVPAEVRAIPQPIALGILEALHRYIETGQGRIRPLSGEFEGLLHCGSAIFRVLFDETEDSINDPDPKRTHKKKRRDSLDTAR